MASPILRQLDLPNLFTLISLVSGFGCAVLAIQGNFYTAIICMMISGIIDMLDGPLARNTERSPLQSDLGKQLDTIVDLCSFGFAPVIFAYCFGMNNAPLLILLAVYLAMTALRLAYFNSTGLLADINSDHENKYFTGLPVTYAALFIPVTFTLSSIVEFNIMKWILSGLYLLLATAMVANFKIIKVQGIWYGLFGFGAIILASFYGWMIYKGN